MNEKLIGYYIFSPLYKSNKCIGYYADTCRYLVDFNYGITDSLLSSAIKQFQNESIAYLNLGLCPFTEMTESFRPTTLLTQLFKLYIFDVPKFPFKGIHHYKAKFKATKAPIFIASRNKLPLLTLFRTWKLMQSSDKNSSIYSEMI